MKSINLLPDGRQQTLRQELIFHNFLAVLWLSVFSFIFIIGLQFLIRLYMLNQTANIEQTITNIQQQVNKQDNAKIKTEVTGVNNYIQDFNNLSNSSPKWSELLKVFAPVPPPDIKITSFTVDMTSKLVIIDGYSPSRESVIALYNNLVNTPGFYNVNYPLENVAKAKNINFHYSFNIKDDLIDGK